MLPLFIYLSLNIQTGTALSDLNRCLCVAWLKFLCGGSPILRAKYCSMLLFAPCCVCGTNLSIVWLGIVVMLVVVVVVVFVVILRCVCMSMWLLCRNGIMLN